MSGFSDTQENSLLDRIYRNQAYTAPTVWWVQLHTADPGESGTTAVASETTRKSATWNAASSQQVTLTSTLAWTSVAATETYTHVTVWDASTAGNFVAAAAITGGAVTAGQSFDLTSLSFSWSGAGLSDTYKDDILDLVLRNQSFTPPATVYTKLYLGAPGGAGTANAATETTRKATTFVAASGGSITLSGSVSWTSVSTSETYSHIGFWTASTAGTFMGSAALDSSVAVTATQDFDLTAVTVSLD
jgi:hypothetical protein